MSWQKVKPYEGPIHQGCLHANKVQTIAPLETIVAVGFGDAHISRDGEIIFSEEQSDDFHALTEFEEMAAKDPDHDWRLTLYGPLRGQAYQRHAEGQWVLIESNEGFA